MSCSIVAIHSFSKEAKRLSKKYHSLKDELIELQNQLLDNPRLGTLIKENTYKIRLAVKSKGKGKSGGMRVITHILELELEVDEDTAEQETTIILVAIYDKSEIENISDRYLSDLIDQIQSELNDEG